MKTDKSNMVGNKGEWSELYTFLKLLSKGVVFAANEKLEKIDDVFYPILKIIREETKGEVCKYIIFDNYIKVQTNSDEQLTVSRKDLENISNLLLSKIFNGKGSFVVDEVCEFANGIKVTKLKAPSSDKTDITLEIQDTYTNFVRNVGFSIKSELGNAPTLLNAGKTTNFIYKVKGLNKSDVSLVNNIETKTKIKDRIQKIKELGGIITYSGMNHSGFKRNLIMIDSKMPEIIGFLLLYHYNEDVKNCSDLVNLLEERDPLNYNNSQIYEYKFKKFICSCALGMKPSEKWDGLDEANGGYIIVKSDGEILAYHIYNRNFFEQYLLDNTMLEKASTSRHDYMKLYEENDDIYIKLNFQIRFK